MPIGQSAYPSVARNTKQNSVVTPFQFLGPAAMPHASLYRRLDRSPRSDVHHVAENTIGHGSEHQAVPVSPEQDWSGRRRAKPAGFLFPASVRWMASLPSGSQATAIGKDFPRIANMLAALWTRPDALTSYLNELLVDRRGRRQGFPNRVLAELHALSVHYATLHLARSDLSDEPK